MRKMKITAVVILCVAVIAGGIFALAVPDAFIRYKVDTSFDYLEAENGIVLIKYTGSEKNIIVPSHIDGKRVISLKGAFCKNNTVENVKLESGIETVDYMTFYECLSLVNVFLPDTVTSIEHAAFFGCAGLEKVHTRKGLREIMPYAFDGCDFLKKIELPEGLLFIGEEAFKDCSRLTSLYIPASVEVIGGVTENKDIATETDQRGSTKHSVFDGCTSLKISIDENNRYYYIDGGELKGTKPAD